MLSVGRRMREMVNWGGRNDVNGKEGKVEIGKEGNVVIGKGKFVNWKRRKWMYVHG